MDDVQQKINEIQKEIVELKMSVQKHEITFNNLEKKLIELTDILKNMIDSNQARISELTDIFKNMIDSNQTRISKLEFKFSLALGIGATLFIIGTHVPPSLITAIFSIFK